MISQKQDDHFPSKVFGFGSTTSCYRQCIRHTKSNDDVTPFDKLIFIPMSQPTRQGRTACSCTTIKVPKKEKKTMNTLRCYSSKKGQRTEQSKCCRNLNRSPSQDVLKTQHSVPQAKLGERGIPSFAGSFILNRGKMLPKF